MLVSNCIVRKQELVQIHRLASAVHMKPVQEYGNLFQCFRCRHALMLIHKAHGNAVHCAGIGGAAAGKGGGMHKALLASVLVIHRVHIQAHFHGQAGKHRLAVSQKFI